MNIRELFSFSLFERAYPCAESSQSLRIRKGVLPELQIDGRKVPVDQALKRREDRKQKESSEHLLGILRFAYTSIWTSL